MVIGWDMFVSERLTRDRSMLEMESLATEEVSPDDDKEGVSNSELVEECVPDLERVAGTGREKTGSVMTRRLVSRLHGGMKQSTHRKYPHHRRKGNVLLSCHVRVGLVAQTSYALRRDRWGTSRSSQPHSETSPLPRAVGQYDVVDPA